MEKRAVKFKDQSNIVKECLEQWNNECRKVFLERLLSKCNGSQLEFLFSVTEPLHHRGFIYSAQHHLVSCPPISTPSSRHEALLFSLTNVADKYYRPKSAVLKSKCRSSWLSAARSNIVERMWQLIEGEQIGSGGLFKSSKSRKTNLSKKCQKEVQQVLEWYADEWTDAQKMDVLYEVLCKLSVHELYISTLILNLRRYRDFITKLPHNLALKILSYLTPRDILNASETCKGWYEVCTSDMTWSVKCSQHAVPAHNPDGVSQQDLFKNNVLLKSNWKDGICRVHCFAGSSHNATDKIRCVAYDPRTSKIATGLISGEIRIWTLSKSGGALISTLFSHTKSVWKVEWYKPNCLISCSSDGTIKIWNIKKGMCQKSIEAHEGKVWTIKCDGDVIFSGSDDKLVKCWEIKRCELIQTYSGHNGSVFTIGISGQDIVLSGAADKTVRVWERQTGECLRSIWVTHASPGWIMSLSVSQGRVACAHNDKVSIFHINTGVTVKTLQSHSGSVEVVKMKLESGMENSGIVVTGSKDKSIHYWELDSGKLHKLEGHKDAVSDLARTSDRIISVSADCSLRTWRFGAPNIPSLRRKTVVSGGMGQLLLYEYQYNEEVSYESEGTSLYKKHLAKRRRQKEMGESGLSRQVMSSLSDMSSLTSPITPVEISTH